MKAYSKKSLLILLFSFSSFSYSKDIVIGTTYEIIEKDAEIELIEKVNSVDWDSELREKNDASKWLATNSEYLPIAQESKVKVHIPFYESEFEIKDGDGKVIYPRGYRFNPLRFVKMPNKIYILTPSTVKYFVGKISNRDQIIIANGNPLDHRKELSAPVFSLDEKTKERLGVENAPSIVWQEGAMLKIEEISLRDLINENR